MIPIRNFGMLWERKYIHYGWQGVKGCLLGYNRRVKDVDFREQIGVYVLYDKDMFPVYVGQTGSSSQRLFIRLKQHEEDHLWNRWKYFSWFGLRDVNKNGSLSQFDKASRRFNVGVTDSLNEIEGVLIKILEPKLNKQGSKWNDVDEFYQQIHKDVEEITLLELYERLNDIEERLDN